MLASPLITAPLDDVSLINDGKTARPSKHKAISSHQEKYTISNLAHFLKATSDRLALFHELTNAMAERNDAINETNTAVSQPQRHLIDQKDHSLT